MKKLSAILAFMFTIAIGFYSCSKDDKKDDEGGLSGTYKINKIEIGSGTFFVDMTEQFINMDCKDAISFEFRNGKVTTNSSNNECENPLEYNGDFSITDNTIETNSLIKGQIVTNTNSSLVIEGDYETAKIRISLNKVN